MDIGGKETERDDDTDRRTKFRGSVAAIPLPSDVDSRDVIEYSSSLEASP